MLKFSLFLLTAATLFAKPLCPMPAQTFYEQVVKSAPNAKPILVRDTDSAVGRYNLHPKTLDLGTLVKAHGHLCDGLTVAYIELSNVLKKLFPEAVDRTDIRVVSKNSPCLVDAAALMTGARINFRTLSLDNSLGGGFIVQQISTGKAYKVHLRAGVVPSSFKSYEKEIRDLRKAGKPVSAEMIDRYDAMAQALIKKLLTADPEKMLEIEELKNYHFTFSLKDIGMRSDTINKNMPRSTACKNAY